MPAIGICVGDVTGIGPEVTLKALAVEIQTAEQFRYLLLGNFEHLTVLKHKLGLSLRLERFAKGTDREKVLVYDPMEKPLPTRLKQGSAPAANAAMAWLKETGERCLRGELQAMVTAPVNKEAIIRAGHKFVGQTEFLSEMAGSNRTAMMLLGEDDRGHWLRVVLATTHLPLKKVSATLSIPRVKLAIELAARACVDLGLPRSRVAVCGVNPHAGEGGHMGNEEQTIIGPAVKAARKGKIDVVGPLSADALFYYAYRGEYDVVVAMYHDQGLVPLKMVGFDTGVNWTLGLPFTRTSPDHGTAYDIAGQGKANPSSMLAAIRLAKKLAGGKNPQ